MWGNLRVTGEIEGEVRGVGVLRFCVTSYVGILPLELKAGDTKGNGDVLEHLQVLPS